MKKNFFIIFILNIFLVGANLYFFSFLVFRQPITIDNLPIKISDTETSDTLPKKPAHYLEDLTPI